MSFHDSNIIFRRVQLLLLEEYLELEWTKDLKAKLSLWPIKTSLHTKKKTDYRYYSNYAILLLTKVRCSIFLFP